MFQFLQGLIKTINMKNYDREHLGFNSYKVWLKLISNPTVFNLSRFQFLQGLIKTNHIVAFCSKRFAFQFLQGLIKTMFLDNIYICEVSFNSYKVWLKRIGKSREWLR